MDIEMADLTDAERDVVHERHRQIVEEGQSISLDDHWIECELAQGAAAYAMHVMDPDAVGWPFSFSLDMWKPKDHRRNCVRAAAMLIAEIERLDRAADKPDPA